MRRVAVVFGVLCVASPVFAGRAGVLPPLEIDYGAVSIAQPEGGDVQATQVLVGLSWASVYPKSTPIDIGAGFIGTFADEPKSRVPRGIGERLPPTNSAAGGFLSFAVRIGERPHMRMWLGGRWEGLRADGTGLIGGAIRASGELWHSTVSKQGTGGAVMGTIALGIWAEAGMRSRSDESLTSFAGGGVSLRVPLIIAY